ncbi:MAG: pyridoxine 5'-phosphate synthase [Legionella sp.]|nr:pyridoxine 5'-phosphate synthase [Legionella sp.]
MTKLSVNVNKIATLRNSRGKNHPNLLQYTLDIIHFGAQGITVHPRPDGRHIQYADVYTIAHAIDVEFNVEGFPDEVYLKLVQEVKPTQCTLVPDPPQTLTSNAGWALVDNQIFLKDTVRRLQDFGIRTALFVDPFTLTAKELDALAIIAPDRIELYTEAYADAFATDTVDEILNVYKTAAAHINQLGIALNAGHDLNLKNLRPFIQAIPNIQEVSIGHALISDALYFGLKETISRYLACLNV